MTKDKADSVIMSGEGSAVKVEHKFDLMEFLHVDWKDRWNVILLIAALIILYFSIRAIVYAMQAKGTP